MLECLLVALLISEIGQLAMFCLQGDHSPCGEPPVDFKTKVQFWPGLARPKRNICFVVNELNGHPVLLQKFL